MATLLRESIKDLAETCTAEECQRLHYARGYCKKHYKYMWRHGLFVEPPMRFTPEKRFWAKVNKDGPIMPGMATACWMWMAGLDKDGYGRFWLDNRGERAHRVSYQWAGGPIPADRETDHRCRNKTCVRPDHLRAIPNKQNQENRRGASRNSTTGVRGVYQRPDGRFRARVKHNGSRIEGGSFDTLERAEEAVIALRNRVFTHNDVDRS